MPFKRGDVVEYQVPNDAYGMQPWHCLDGSIGICTGRHAEPGEEVVVERDGTRHTERRAKHSTEVSWITSPRVPEAKTFCKGRGYYADYLLRVIGHIELPPEEGTNDESTSD